MNKYTAIVQRDNDWWIGWIKEVQGVNSQGVTREELIENLQSALGELIELNAEEALEQALDGYEEVEIAV